MAAVNKVFRREAWPQHPILMPRGPPQSKSLHNARHTGCTLLQAVAQPEAAVGEEALPVAPSAVHPSSRAATDFEYDAVIIGSGIGGLTTATQMAARGAKVVVLEKCVPRAYNVQLHALSFPIIVKLSSNRESRLYGAALFTHCPACPCHNMLGKIWAGIKDLLDKPSLQAPSACVWPPFGDLCRATGPASQCLSACQAALQRTIACLL